MTDPPSGEHPEWARYKRPGPEAGPSPAGGMEPETPAPGDAETPTAADSTATADAGASPFVAPSEPDRGFLPATLVPGESWKPDEPLTTELETQIRRDLVRGRKIVRLTWVGALASLVLGLVAVRQSALLVAIDRRLVTTEEVQAAGGSFDIARSVLLLAAALGIVLAIHWLRGALPVFAELRRRGVIGGPEPRGTGIRDRLDLLWRPAGVPADRAGWADLRVGDGRRVARLAMVAVILATIVGLVAAIWLGAAHDAVTSRQLRIVSGIDGGLWLVASILVGVAIDALLWREAVAARALGVFIPLVDAPGRAIFRLLPPILVFGAGVLVASGRPDPWYVPCPESTLSCDGMLVPVDHDGGGSTATIWIVYAVHHAEGKPVGTLVVAVGGPGESGLDASLNRIEGLDPDLVRRYDILFFDQRGVGASEGLDCPKAAADYATAPPEPSAAAAYANACLEETHAAAATLSRYATRQAAEDLDSIRDRLGIDKFALYGESYGTEFAQIYAALHPDRLTALILDGSVDLTRSAIDFWADASHGFDAVLTDTLRACRTDRACNAELDDPAGTYDRTLARFRTPQSRSWADQDGVVRDHVVGASTIEAAIDSLLYDPAGRMLIQRAVAAAGRGDDVPFARLVEILGSGEQSGFSSFAYQAITCADYRLSPTADPHDVAAVEAARIALGVGGLRTDEVFSSVYPCLSWPYQPVDGGRPAPLTTTPFPVFVLGATDDPITPIDQGRAIAARLADGYLVVTTGGPHVTFGRGDSCVDGPVDAFLLDGRRPATRSIDCTGEIADAYTPLTAETLSGYRDALDAMSATESELVADPIYRTWAGSSEIHVGCRYGGFVAVEPATGQDNLRFVDCAFVAGLALRGTGTYTFSGQRVTWSVTVPNGQLDYQSTGIGQHVSGTWNGAPVDIAR